MKSKEKGTEDEERITYEEGRNLEGFEGKRKRSKLNFLKKDANLSKFVDVFSQAKFGHFSSPNSSPSKPTVGSRVFGRDKNRVYMSFFHPDLSAFSFSLHPSPFGLPTPRLVKHVPFKHSATTISNLELKKYSQYPKLSDNLNP